MWARVVNQDGVPWRAGKDPTQREDLRPVKGNFVSEPRGVVDMNCKGKMETWFLVGARCFLPM